MKNLDIVKSPGQHECRFSNMGKNSFDSGFQKNNSGYKISENNNKKVWWNILDETIYVAAVDPQEAGCQLRFNNKITSSKCIKQHDLSASNFAHTHPDWSSGQGKVASIGVRWTLPALMHNKPPQTELDKKPMWSWLVTESSQLIKQTTQTQQSLLTCSHSSSFNEHMKSKKKHHARDLHPISTAMDRHGTSISKTKWNVPSYGISRLDSDQALLGHLKLSKISKCDMLHCVSVGNRK